MTQRPRGASLVAVRYQLTRVSANLTKDSLHCKSLRHKGRGKWRAGRPDPSNPPVAKFFTVIL